MEPNSIQLTSFTFPHEAQQAVSYLAANEIFCTLKDEMTVTVHPFYSNAIGGVKIMVTPLDFEKGKQLLIQGGYIQENSMKTEMKKFPTDTKCPFCQSENIDKKRTPGIMTIILYITLGALFPVLKSNMICYECNKSWKFRTISST
ncbi:hypothetical protein [Natronoflexus pectinivorans]|uniref:Signal transducing protein n=1 Tax=Natronoflexus pectinivorans TaxID=682526 RepID=A0A4R2GJA7_9BACT|nr:hypothetical protein [Natronoflexus pectinivorans]TCO08032.1 hypothetical protein EV194_106174 [Natronoflexus pectinivorans]